MITLSTPKDPYDLDLPYGITVTVKPLTSSGMAAAQAAARRRLESLESQYRERKEAGLPTDDLPDLDDAAERDGLYHGLLVHELAARHIVSWSGVLAEDGNGDAPVSREAVAAVMDLYPVGERFFQEFTLAPGAAQRRKKRIRALCRWHFKPGGGPEYCRGCEEQGLACAEGGVGLTEERCPYREHAPADPRGTPGLGHRPGRAEPPPRRTRRARCSASISGSPWSSPAPAAMTSRS